MSDPINAITAMLESKGWSRRHLYPAFGTSAKASEIMNRKRPLTLSMIRCLVFNYGMSAETLIKWYPTEMQPVEPINLMLQTFFEVANARPQTIGRRRHE